MMAPEPAALRRGWPVALSTVFIVAFLLPNAVALFIPYEEFPYTSAPMFAHYVTDNTPRYRFRFFAEYPNGHASQEIRAADLKLNGTMFSRYFFGSVYGSIEPLSPYGHYGNDTRETFEKRLTEFFHSATIVLNQRPEAPSAIGRIRLEVAQLDKGNRDSAAHIVGYYHVKSNHFSHTWRPKS
jgi:hypothetical protein